MSFFEQTYSWHSKRRQAQVRVLRNSLSRGGDRWVSDSFTFNFPQYFTSDQSAFLWVKRRPTRSAESVVSLSDCYWSDWNQKTDLILDVNDSAGDFARKRLEVNLERRRVQFFTCQEPSTIHFLQHVDIVRITHDHRRRNYVFVSSRSSFLRYATRSVFFFTWSDNLTTKFISFRMQSAKSCYEELGLMFWCCVFSVIAAAAVLTVLLWHTNFTSTDEKLSIVDCEIECSRHVSIVRHCRVRVMRILSTRLSRASVERRFDWITTELVIDLKKRYLQFFEYQIQTDTISRHQWLNGSCVVDLSENRLQ